jgi:hypothetical protein
MSAPVKCTCQSCTIRGFIGPAIVITLGVLLLLNEVRGGSLYFGNTWPVLLVVIGLIHLASSMASREGHIQPQPPVVLPPPPPAPPLANPQSPYSPQGR